MYVDYTELVRAKSVVTAKDKKMSECDCYFKLATEYTTPLIFNITFSDGEIITSDDFVQIAEIFLR